MYIVSCHNCGEIKIISSVPTKNGITRAYWCCPVCGTGQLVEILSLRTAHCSSLHNIIAGLGFVSGRDGKISFRPQKKGFPSIYD